MSEEEIKQNSTASLPSPKRERQRDWLPSLVWLIQFLPP